MKSLPTKLLTLLRHVENQSILHFDSFFEPSIVPIQTQLDTFVVCVKLFR